MTKSQFPIKPQAPNSKKRLLGFIPPAGGLGFCWALSIGIWDLLSKQMLSKTHKIYTYLLILLFAVAPLGVFGQALPGFGGNITLTVTPEFPRANEEVVVSARGFSVDLDRAEVSWVLNGTLEKRAVGGTAFSFRAGALGKTSLL